MGPEIRYPSSEQVKRLYDEIVRRTGGEHGCLSKSNLEYVIDTVKDVGNNLSRDRAVVAKAAFLLHTVIRLHPFLNGNKRTAYEIARLFVHLNGFDIAAGKEDAYSFLLEIARGEASADRVEAWIETNLTGREPEK